MKYEKVSVDAFLIAGISVRTANQNGRASLDIKKIWEDFRLNLKNIADDINNRCRTTSIVSTQITKATKMANIQLLSAIKSAIQTTSRANIRSKKFPLPITIK